MYEKYLNIKNRHIRKIKFRSPNIIFHEHASKTGSALLTGSGDQTNSEFSVIGIEPNLMVSYDTGIMDINGHMAKVPNIWGWLKEFLGATTFHDLPYPANKIGLIGYFSYEMCHEVERLPKTTTDSYQVPQFQFLVYNRYYVFDNISEQAWEIILDYEKRHYFPNTKSDYQDYTVKNVTAELTQEKYVSRVEKILDYIRQGDVYEVNFTQ